MEHLSNLRNKKHHSFKLQNRFDTYGETQLKFYELKLTRLESVIESSNSNKELSRYLKSTEQGFIERYHPELNIDYETTARRHWE